MTLYLQQLDELLAVRDRPSRHRVAITLCSMAGDLQCALERTTDEKAAESIVMAIAQLDDLASTLCASWYDVDYDDPTTYATGEYDTDRLLRLTSSGATAN